MFRRNLSPPSSGSKNKPTALLTACFMQIFFWLTYSLTLKMEVRCSSETSVDFQWTTWRYIPKGRALHNHHCENLKSYIYVFFGGSLYFSLYSQMFWFSLCFFFHYTPLCIQVDKGSSFNFGTGSTLSFCGFPVSGQITRCYPEIKP
jgi:hypothetical protein